MSHGIHEKKKKSKHIRKKKVRKKILSKFRKKKARPKITKTIIIKLGYTLSRRT